MVSARLSGVDEVVRYSFRLRPGRTAEAALLTEWHRCGIVWNEAVNQQKLGNKPTFGKLSKLLTDARACSSCFARAKQRLELGERTFRCDRCGFTAGRDRNAARVILAVAERGHTRVEDVRQSDHLPRGAGSGAA
ncbi:zinc ribbon domain-containing protein [Nocardia sp.]|uniref:zinc ribbon domain-containing protein n=1 Tax=Nocardia sp. TaxID=1821 RepID=UPI0026144E37|nr:zinc ribbon domain-containing protein [Nocardia sp.]